MVITCLFSLLMQSALTLDQIMDDPVWMGELALEVKADESGDGFVIRIQTPVGAPALWKTISRAGELGELDADSRISALANEKLIYGTQSVSTVAGGLWLSDETSVRPIMQGLSAVSLADWRREGLTYQRDSQLWIWRPQLNQHFQLLAFDYSDEKSETDDWASKEEPTLIAYVEHLERQREAGESYKEQNRELSTYRTAKPVLVGKDWQLSDLGYWEDNRYRLGVSDDMRYGYGVFSSKEEGDATQYAQFVNEDAKVKALDARPKVGHETPSWKVALVDRVDDSVKWLDFSTLPDISVPRRKLLDGKTSDDQTTRPVFVAAGGFQRASNYLLLTVYSQDYKDRWICLANATTAELTLLHHHHDPAWVQFYLSNVDHSPTVTGRAFWTEDQQAVAFLSDENGYQNLFTININDRRLNSVVAGRFEVYSPYQQGGDWYFHANKQHPGVTHFYRKTDNKLEQLTQGTGLHDAFFVEDQLIDLASEGNRPPYLKIKSANQSWRELYDGRSADFRQFEWSEPEYVSYSNGDKGEVHARLYRPAKPNGAGVVFVHGAGYLQNAHKGWSGYFREYMFHNLLVERGYTVIDPDYRASSGYGRDWRTAIYRYMGDKDLEDVVQAASYLTGLGVDASRLGVYGGSYGGFITLMAMFTRPDAFAAGAALRPVTDWAYYNHWYTSRILNTPQSDPESYRRSSPIYFAEGLTGQLIICHGMVDDNVQFQDSVRLAQRLIELKKSGWTLNGYPVEAHGFRMPSSWYDEYRRIFELFESTLIQ